MRVTRPVSAGGQRRQQQRQLQQQQQQQQQQPYPAHAAAVGSVGATQTVTYDLRRRSAGKEEYSSGGGGDGGPEARERMPRDVKDRMKALPRFISILKGGTSTKRNNDAADSGGAGRRVASPGREVGGR